MDGPVRDRALALLKALPDNAALSEVVDTVRSLTDARHGSSRPSDQYTSEARFRLIFERSGLGIALVGRDGRLIRANRAFADLLGYSEAELEGKPFTELTHPDDIAIDYAHYEALVAGVRDHYQIDKRYLRKDGRVVWGRLTASLVTGEETTGVFGIGMVEDITEVRAAREEQSRLVSVLNQRVKELTALHGTARLLQDEMLATSILFARVASPTRITLLQNKKTLLLLEKQKKDGWKCV